MSFFKPSFKISDYKLNDMYSFKYYFNRIIHILLAV